MNATRKEKRKTHFKQGAWGTACRNGKFYEFTDRHVLVMKAWPDPRAWFKRRSHGWRQTRKFADAVFSSRDFLQESGVSEVPGNPFMLQEGQFTPPGITEEEKSARRDYSAYLARTAFLSQIPTEVREELQKYSTRRWHMLNLFARCPGSMDLSRSNPALAFALASNWVFHKPAVQQPIRAARKLVWKKQKTILQWLEFPPTESIRKTLAKILPEALNIEMLLYLREAIVNPACAKLLSHLPHLSREVVMSASDFRLTEHVTPKLLEDILIHERRPASLPNPEDEGRQSPYELLMDTVRMANIVNWEKCPTTFSSLKRVKTLHDELAPRMSIANLRRGCTMPARFAEPPFPGTEHIIPLTTPEEVCREGHIQKNCVGSHLINIINGFEYVYRVEQPVRGTAALVFRFGRWIPSQFYKACNKPVKNEVRSAVFKALYESELKQDASL